jgi:carbonic anhydrase
MTGAASLLAASGLSVGRLRAEQPQTPTPPQNAIAPSEALDRLMQGNARYVANTPNERDFSAGRAERAVVQYLIVAVLSCSDSRVAPELVFDQGPGDVFVVRLAVKFLGAPLVMVLGHTNCGAVAAAVKVVQEHAELPGHLPDLVKSIEPAVIAAHAKHPSDLVAAAIEENVRLNTKRLVDDAPILTDAFAAKKLNVVGGIYDLATGKVDLI